MRARTVAHILYGFSLVISVVSRKLYVLSHTALGLAFTIRISTTAVWKEDNQVFD